jgi:hypothetical protein
MLAHRPPRSLGSADCISFWPHPSGKIKNMNTETFIPNGCGFLPSSARADHAVTGIEELLRPAGILFQAERANVPSAQREQNPALGRRVRASHRTQLAQRGPVDSPALGDSHHVNRMAGRSLTPPGERRRSLPPSGGTGRTFHWEPLVLMRQPLLLVLLMGTIRSND